MRLHLPDGLSLTMSGIIRQRESGFTLEMPDMDFKTNQPITHVFPLVGRDAEVQTQLQAQVGRAVTLRGVWHLEGAEDGPTDAGFLEVTAVEPQGIK